MIRRLLNAVTVIWWPLYAILVFRGSHSVILLAITFILAAAEVAILVRRSWKSIVRINRETSGQCGTCSYDLRASSNRCPECGTQIRANY